MNYCWENKYIIRGNIITDYVKINVNERGQGEMEARIKGLTSWHEYDFNILAFLIKQLND
jgi:hypothetical protein